MGEARRFGRRSLLGGAVAAGAAVAGLASPTAARGNDGQFVLRAPGSLPSPHLPPGTDTIPVIEHVVILMMENHSFDDHFGMLGRGDGLSVAHDGTPLNYNPAPGGGYILSYPMPNTAVPVNSQISQSWDASHLCWDNGTNAGFAQTCGPASMGHFTGDQLPFYYSLANSFPIADRYFASVMAQTYPNRRFLIAGTALGDVATNGSGISAMDAPNGTIFDRLDAYGVTWKDYFPDVPTAALFLPEYLNNLSDGRMAPINQFLTDAAAGQLPEFSLVDPYVNYSEENGDISVGEAYAARIIGAVLSSPNWSTTAMFLVYDEHGGWYDHVPPQPAIPPDDVLPEITVPPNQPGSYNFTGFRVPCVVISPFARKNFVSHVVHEHTSLLKFVETKWNLPAMTYRDANAPDMLEFFKLNGRPPFEEPPTLQSPLNPFVGPLPANSGAAGFHPVATGVQAASLPSAAFRVTAPPRP
jgi:phospholipase C